MTVTTIEGVEVVRSTLPSFSTIFRSPLEYFRSLLRYVLIQALRRGPVPEHIGFVMDGNRRFAKKMNVKAGEGHYMGFKKMEEVLEICLELGVKVVTVYAFSIDNFKRPKDEVDTLMKLAKSKLVELCEHSDVVRQHGVCVQIIGNKSYMPADVMEVVEKAMDLTKGSNNRAILNLCCPYTSRDEITTAIRTVVRKAEQGQVEVDDITEKLLDESLFTHGTPPLEVMIRTSGEIRLSDFLLWQSHQNCRIHFVDCFWPEFSLWDFLPILLDYQRSVK